MYNLSNKHEVFKNACIIAAVNYWNIPINNFIDWNATFFNCPAPAAFGSSVDKAFDLRAKGTGFDNGQSEK